MRFVASWCLIQIVLLVACTGQPAPILREPAESANEEARTLAPGLVMPSEASSEEQHYNDVIAYVLGGSNRDGDLDKFWRATIAVTWPNVRYEPPTGFEGYTVSEQPDTACRFPGDIWQENAQYCSVDRLILWDEQFLRDMYDYFGDMAPVVTLAHEWGHHVQHLTGAPAHSIQAELQADCYAGLYARHVDRNGVLEPGDVEEGMQLFFALGDEYFDAANWFAENVHGPSDARSNAFLTGYETGNIASCLSYAHLSSFEKPHIRAYESERDKDATCVICGIQGWAGPKEPGHQLWEVTLSTRHHLLVALAWCAVDEQTLYDNWQDMEYTLSVDGYRIDLGQLHTTAYSTSEGNYCLSHSGIIDEWTPGHHSIIWTHHLDRDVDDGWDIYPQGSYIMEFVVNVPS